ncbi:UNKNOWN [Stylonychia lemnae]|uniref:FYVE-type domain-containing protein n=1 Tax=Stylonychia lemnae TaxID=5949 RepID=A0A078ANV0_STYLE|nr:UNKNOWN [Stylonychia lemnae]|eukprot:CDW83611.1 UNKNOWN [Stylonychia lemnae]
MIAQQNSLEGSAYSPLNSEGGNYYEEFEKPRIVKQKAFCQTNILLRPYSLMIRKHTVIDEKDPFILYAIEIESEFSKYIVLKQFKNFIKLQQDLVKLKDCTVEMCPRIGSLGAECVSLEKLIPKLPSSFIGLLFKSMPTNQNIHLIELIAKASYVQLGQSQIDDELEEAQVTLTKTHHTQVNDYLKYDKRPKTLRKIRQRISFSSMFISKEDTKGMSSRFLQQLQYSFLVIQLHRKSIRLASFRSSQLIVLGLKFCPQISGETLGLIAEWANPFYLKELYLDGCDKINDQAMMNLVKKRVNNQFRMPDISDQFDQNANHVAKTYSSIIDSADGMRRITEEVSQGGAYGLHVISLAECKNINDAGINHLKNLRYLHKVILLGCFNVKDDGVHELATNLKYLEDIDISGTSITLVSLSCKKLNASDDKILLKHKINVEGGDDVFRFYLLPEIYSDLPKITTSVLKTRATLSVHKVYRYLLKKLYMDRAIEEMPEDTLADSQVEILCNNKIMNPQLQLKFVRENYWNNEQQILVLHYRKKETNSSQSNNLKALDSARSVDYQPQKPPLWVPDHLALNCLNCDREFTLFRRIHHCRNCGKCFCNECSKNWMPIEKFGYYSPVRMCSRCKVDILSEKLANFKYQQCLTEESNQYNTQNANHIDRNNMINTNINNMDS